MAASGHRQPTTPTLRTGQPRTIAGPWACHWAAVHSMRSTKPQENDAVIPSSSLVILVKSTGSVVPQPRGALTPRMSQKSRDQAVA